MSVEIPKGVNQKGLYNPATFREISSDGNALERCMAFNDEDGGGELTFDEFVRAYFGSCDVGLDLDENNDETKTLEPSMPTMESKTNGSS